MGHLMDDDHSAARLPSSAEALPRTINVMISEANGHAQLETLMCISSSRHSSRFLGVAKVAAVGPTSAMICFELVYRRLVVRLGHAQAIGAIAHRLCRLVWKVLHDGVAYEERGPAVTKARAQRRAAKMIRELRSLGYRIERGFAPASTPA